MANVIKHKRGSGSDPSASNLVVGELAIRTDTGKLFTKMDSGALAEIAGGGSDIAINTLSSSSGTGGGSATFNGSAYRFTLSSPPSVSAAQLLVSINGVIQKPVAGTGQPSEGFSVDGNDIILGDAPATGADFFILTFRSLGVSVPADNSVTSAKIVDGAIVNADINASAAIAGSKINPVSLADVGIGVSSPNVRLHQHIGTSGTNSHRFTNTTTGTGSTDGFILGLSGDEHVLLWNYENTPFRLATNSTERVRVTESGNVGIGTSSPSYRLSVEAASGTDVTALFKSDDANAWIQIRDNTTTDTGVMVGANGDNLLLRAGSNERMRINSSGLVNIGSGANASGLSPLLHLHKDASSATAYLHITNTDSGITNNDGFVLGFNGSNDALVFNKESTPLRFATAGTERMRITPTGRVNIGDTQMSQNLLNIEDGTAAAIDIASHGSGGDTAYIGVKKSTGGGLTFGISNRDIIFKTGATYNNGTTFDSGTERFRITSTDISIPNNNAKLNFGTGNELQIYHDGTNSRIVESGAGALMIQGNYVDINTVDGSQLKARFIDNGAAELYDSGNKKFETSGSGVTVTGTALFAKSVYGDQASEDFYRIKFFDTGGIANDVGIGQPDSSSLGFNVVSSGTIRFYRGTANEHTRFTTNGELRVNHGNGSESTTSTDHVHGIGNTSLDTVTTNLARLVMQERQGNWISFKQGGGAHYGTIALVSGNVSYGGQSSDYRIKENVVNVSNGITLLKQLRPVNFTYTSDSGFTTEEQAKVRIGFIAHEFAEICPTGVIGEKDGMDIWGDCTNSEGETTQTHVPESKKVDGETWTEKSRKPNYQQIDFSKAVPILTAALQEAIARIEALEAK